ncbi:MAG: hypothetical protein QM706_16120 [Nitrospira sp.]
MGSEYDSNQRYGLIIAVVLLCVCVLTQVLGVPGTLIDLLTSSDTLVESVLEDALLTPAVTEPRALSFNFAHVISQTSVHLPVFVTSVFHPPQA